MNTILPSRLKLNRDVNAIPFGLRESYIKSAYEKTVAEMKEDFLKHNPVPFQEDDLVELPKEKKVFWGGWEVFDPVDLNPRLSAPIPHQARVNKVFICTSLVDETLWRIKEGRGDDINILAKYTTMPGLMGFFRNRFQNQLYWACTLKGVCWTWSMPCDFLAKIHEFER